MPDVSWMAQYGWIVWGLCVFVCVMLFWILFGYPKWQVWASHQDGLADLTRAKNEQQIQIAQAQSRLDAATLNKKAAIIEAEAVAAQIEAIGAKLTEHGLFLKWQWIKMMDDRSEELGTSVIYVPTEANIPILEATRLKSREDEEA